jgi:TP901 family phage tail tape measure protein
MASQNTMSVLFDLVTAQAEANARALSGSLIGINSAVDLAVKGLSAATEVLGVIAGAFVDATKNAIAFEYGLAGIKTIAQDANLDSLRKELLDISSAWGFDELSAATAQYDLISSGFTDTADAAKVLSASAALATAGMGELGGTAKVVAVAINAFSLKAADADRVTDVLTKTTQFGVTTLNELGPAFGQVASIAAGAAVSLEETSAAMATLTLTGKTASESATGLKSLLSSLLKPSEDLQKAFKTVSDKSIAASIAQDGLGKTLELIRGKIGSGSDQWIKYLGSVDAASAGITLATGKNKEFTDITAAMNDKTKAAGEATREMAAIVKASASNSIDVMNQSMKNLGVEIFSVFEPAIAAAAQTVTGFVQDVKNFARDNEEYLRAVGKSAVQMVRDFGEMVKAVIASDDLRRSLITLKEIGVSAFEKFTEAFSKFGGEYTKTDGLLGKLADVLAQLKPAIDAVAKAMGYWVGWVVDISTMLPRLALEYIPRLADGLNSLHKTLKAVGMGAGESFNAAFGSETAKKAKDFAAITDLGTAAFGNQKKAVDPLVASFKKMTKENETALGAMSKREAALKRGTALEGEAAASAKKLSAEQTKAAKDAAKAAEEAADRAEENERNSYANRQTILDDYRANFDSFSKGIMTTQQEMNKDIKELDEKQAKEKEKNAKDALDLQVKINKEYEASLKELAGIMEKAADEERKRMLKRIDAFKEMLGIIKQIASGYSEMFSGVGGALPKIAAGDLLSGTKEALTGLFSGLADVAGGFARYFADTFSSMVVGVAGFLSDRLMAVAPKISEYLGGIIGEEFKEKFLALGTVAGEALAGGFRLAVGLLESSLQTAMATVQTLFQAVSGGFVASLASGVKSVLDSFEANIKTLNEGTASIMTFGKADTTEQKKAIADKEQAEIEAIKKRYTEEIDASREASGTISADKKKALDAELKAIKAKEEAEIKAKKKAFESSAVVTDDKGLVEAELKRIKATEDAEILAKKRVSDEAIRLLDEQKRTALAAGGLSAQEKANITTLFAEKKAQEKIALEDAVNAIKAKATADTERIKNLSSQEKARIKEENAARKEADAERLANEIEAIKVASDAATQAAKDRAAGLNEEQKAKIKALEDAREAEIKAAKDASQTEEKNVSDKAESRNIFEDIVASADAFIDAFVNRLPEIVQSFISSVPKLVVSFVKNIPKIVEAFTKNLKPMITALTAAIGPILTTVAQQLPIIIGSIAEVLPGIFTELAQYLPGVIGTLIDELVKALPKILPSFILLISNLIQTIVSKIPQILTAILGMIPLIIAEIPKIFGSIIQAIPGIITAIIDSIPAIISAVIVAIPNIIGEIIKALPQILLSIVTLIPRLVGSIIMGIVDGLSKILPNFLAAGAKIFQGFGDALVKAWEWVKQFGTQIWTGLKEGIAKAIEWIKGIGSWIWNGLSTGITKAIDWIKGIGSWIWNGLSKGISGAIDWLKGVGKWIWDGLANGIYKAIDWIKGIGGWIWDGMASAIYAAGDWIASAFSWWSDGGIVGGSAQFSGDDRRNDTVPAFLSPGELVVPRSAMDGGMAEIMSFVSNALGRSTQRMASGGVAGVESQRAAQRGSSDDLRGILSALGGQEIVVQIDGQTVARAVRSQVQKGFKL